MNHELDFTSLVNEEESMSEHKIAQDNIDIDVDVSSTVAEDNEQDISSDTISESASATVKNNNLDDSDKDSKAEDYLPLLPCEMSSSIRTCKSPYL